MLLSAAPLEALSAPTTAASIMNQTADKIKTAKGINCKFTLSSNQGKLNGSLKVAGVKFALNTPASSSWYNGKNLWTYNSSSKETTLVSPTSSELRESNPLEYIKGYSTAYTPAFSKTKQAGKYLITLTPKKKSNEVKTLDITLNAKTLKPEVISIMLKSGIKSEISINSIDYNAVFKATDFEYPGSKYPKVPIVDLR